MLKVRTNQNPKEDNRLENFFPKPKENIEKGHQDLSRIGLAAKETLQERWKSSNGLAILSKISRFGHDRNELKSLVGKVFGKLDLRGAPLKSANFESANLKSVDFFGSDLRSANFFGANLDNSHFSEADIRGATFDYASMKNTQLDRARYNRKTTFIGVDIRKTNFNLSIMLQDQVRNQQRINHLNNRHRYLSFFLKWTCDYGQSFWRFLVCAMAAVTLFAGLYYWLDVSRNIESFFDALYFSVVTFATLGFGDIAPETSIGRVLVITEVVIGYVMGGLLIAILVRRTIGH